jgi:hypothetical protein
MSEGLLAEQPIVKKTRGNPPCNFSEKVGSSGLYPGRYIVLLQTLPASLSLVFL